MKPIVRIKEWASLNKLNNNEYAEFMRRFRELVEKAGSLEGQEERSALGFEWADYDVFAADQRLVTDLVGESRVQLQTEEMGLVDKERSGEVSYLFLYLRTKKHTHQKEQRQAAVTLYNIAKPCVGCQRLPAMQKTATISALLFDLRKEEVAPLVSLLHLEEVLDRLEALNNQYAALMNERAKVRIATKLEDSKSVRKRMSLYYDYLTAMAFVQSVAHPTEATAHFVRSLNALIDEVRASYNQRIAQVRAYRAKQEAGNQEAEKRPDGNPASDPVS